MNDMLTPTFRGTTESPHIEDGVVVTFDRHIPDQWEAKTTVYVDHASGSETTFDNEDMATTEVFRFKPRSWSTLHVTLVKFEPTKLRVQALGSDTAPHEDLPAPNI